LLNSHFAGKSPTYLAEYRLKAKNEEYKWILARGKVIKRDHEGRALRFIGTHTDITENKLNQEKINKVNQHYQSLIEKASDGIVLIDVDGNLKYSSPSANRIFGYPENEKIDIKPLSLTYPDDLQLVSSTFQELILFPMKMRTLQYRIKNTKGDWLWIESTFRSLLSDSNVNAVVINFRDITSSKKAEDEIKKMNEVLEQKVRERTTELEKKQAELVNNEAALLNLVEDLNFKSEELKRSTTMLEAANKELEAFTYSVSHDLRSPLRAINGFVNILIEDYSHLLDQEGKRICGIIQNNATKMGQLIDDLLAFSRLIKSDINVSAIDMDDLVKNVIADFGMTTDLSTKKITIDQLPETRGDRNMMKQVWVNLISNALKYSSKNKYAEIEIGCFKKDEADVYYIKDNGVGFNMDYAHKLFGVFQRLHGVNDFEGTGVGLAIVHRIISRHQGKIWAEGEVGKGASFYFTLPNN
jgi:PAS domain S-box-containing protein